MNVEEMKRLSKQCQRIYERLQKGPATNAELSRIALKYTSRISDLRQHDINVVCSDRNYKTGLTLYELEAA